MAAQHGSRPEFFSLLQSMRRDIKQAKEARIAAVRPAQGQPLQFWWSQYPGLEGYIRD
jgi:hypothetical protein